MVTAAQLVLDQSAAGQQPEVDAVPPFQWRERFDELKSICPSRLGVEAGRDFNRQKNALRCEMVPDTDPRCARLSPDGRGLAWFASGGSPLAYGKCVACACPRAKAGGQ